jgi:exopolyphosphatase/guanosine-5'-triphosphate,3'-diphosphate pyrophosphatase
MRVLAAIDLGTNSSLFLLAQVDRNGRITPLRQEVRTNDLGRGLDEEGRLSPATIELNLKQLSEFKKIAEDTDAVEIRVAATAALRRAINADDLIDKARTNLNLKIRTISGLEEARLTYQGVISGLEDPAQKILLADVGGGSTEISLGVAGFPVKSVSLGIGVVSLDRHFIRHDPATAEEIGAIRERIQQSFNEIPDFDEIADARMIICGGTASALASADLGLESYQPEKLADHRITNRRLKRFIKQFADLNLEERRGIPGLGWRRAEIILPGALIIANLLQKFKREEYFTSERGLRYGLLVSGV